MRSISQLQLFILPAPFLGNSLHICRLAHAKPPFVKKQHKPLSVKPQRMPLYSVLVICVRIISFRARVVCAHFGPISPFLSVFLWMVSYESGWLHPERPQYPRLIALHHRDPLAALRQRSVAVEQVLARVHHTVRAYVGELTISSLPQSHRDYQVF